MTSKLITLGRTTELRALGCGRLWCAACARLVSMATLEQAAVLTEFSVDALLERINGKRLHSLRKTNGEFLVCLDSLLRGSLSISARR